MQDQTITKELIKVDQKVQLELLDSFLEKNRNDLTKFVTKEKIKATVVPDAEEFMPVLGEMIRNGQLVSFPTETVYGLGADATNEKALLEIYRVKKRPLTDPIIVHVLDFKSALSLVEDLSQIDRNLFYELTQQFWPGPLTCILKANLQILPAVVTAQTGFVGIRSPKSSTARRLIQISQRPIGAPSANLFSHVSPTSAVHVFNDFYDQEITIVDGKKCEYGVESTVIKIINGKLQILREGSFSTAKLAQFVNKKFDKKVEIVVKKKSQKNEGNQNMEAPGQLLKHYAPYLPCFYVQIEDLLKEKSNQIELKTQNLRISLSNAALISFSNQFNKLQPKFKYFLQCGGEGEELEMVQQEEEDKFCTFQQKKKMRSLYYLLRKAENLDVSVILIGWNAEKQGTLWDKIYRSTQGEQANIF